MNSNIDIWSIMTGAQVSTALLVIAVALAAIAFKMYDNSSKKKHATHD